MIRRKWKAICLIAPCALPHAAYASAPVQWDFSGNGGTHILADTRVESVRTGVAIYSESSSTPSMTIRSPKRYNLFGVAKSSAGDIDADGYDDILIGAPLWGPNESNPGAAYIYSGATGLRLLTLHGRGANDYFGRAVAGAGDINGDGIPDQLVCGWFHSETGVPYGRVYLLSGSDGKALATITSYEENDGFGYTLASLGDLRYYLHASNPLIPQGFAPAIDVYGDGERPPLTFTWSVDGATGEQTINWVADLFHDRFPAHQMYFGPHRTQPVMSFDPIPAGHTPFNLFSGDWREFSSNGEVNQ